MKSILALSFLMGFCTIASAKGTEKPTSITGEVVDITCYADHGAKGEKHAACAQKCLTGGSPAGIVADGKLYVVTMKDHSPPSTKLAEYAGKNITAEGTKKDMEGTHIFEIDTFTPAK